MTQSYSGYKNADRRQRWHAHLPPMPLTLLRLRKPVSVGVRGSLFGSGLISLDAGREDFITGLRGCLPLSIGLSGDVDRSAVLVAVNVGENTR